MNAEVTEKLVRFQQPEKVLPYLNGLDEARAAGLFGLDPVEYRDLRAGFTERARQAAIELLENADRSRSASKAKPWTVLPLFCRTGWSGTNGPGAVNPVSERPQ